MEKPLSYFLICFVIPICAITWFSGTTLHKIDALEAQLKNGGAALQADSSPYFKQQANMYKGEINLLLDSVNFLNAVVSHNITSPVIRVHDTIYIPGKTVSKPGEVITKIEYVDRPVEKVVTKTEYVDRPVERVVTKTEYVDRPVYIHDTIRMYKPPPTNDGNNYGRLQEQVQSLINNTRYIPDTTKISLMRSISMLFRRYRP